MLWCDGISSDVMCDGDDDDDVLLVLGGVMGCAVAGRVRRTDQGEGHAGDGMSSHNSIHQHPSASISHNTSSSSSLAAALACLIPSSLVGCHFLLLSTVIVNNAWMAEME